MTAEIINQCSIFYDKIRPFKSINKSAFCVLDYIIFQVTLLESLVASVNVFDS